MKERVLIDLERKRYPYSGLGYYCRCLEEGLCSCPEKLPHWAFYNGEPWSGKKIHSFSPLHKILNLAPRNYKVLHLTHQGQRYFRQCFGEKRIVTLHDLNFVYENLIPRRYNRWLRNARRNLNRADVIVCISHFVKQSLMDNLHLFQLKPDVRIEVIYNGIHLEQGESSPFVAGHNLTNVPYLLCIGVLEEKKNQEALLKMLTHLPEAYHLVLVYSSGRADYIARVRSLVDSLRLRDRVHFFSNIERSQKTDLLNHCRALVHPSTAEGFGIPPVEAMSCGKPVFLSTHTSLPEVGGPHAFYFPHDFDPQGMADALLQGLQAYDTDPSYPERLREWAQRYDYRRMSEEYYRLYEEVLKSAE